MEVTGGNLVSPDVLNWMYTWGNNELESHEWQFTSVESVATLIVSANNGVLPESQEEINRILAEIPAETLRPYLLDGQWAVISFGMNSMSLEAERSLAEQVSRDIAFYQPPPGVEAVVTGTPYSDVELMKEMNTGKLQRVPVGAVPESWKSCGAADSDRFDHRLERCGDVSAWY